MGKYFLVMDFIDGIPVYSKTEVLAKNLREVLFIALINKLEFLEIHKETDIETI